MPNHIWKAFFMDSNPENPQHPDGIVQTLEIEDIIAGPNTINGSGNHPYFGKFTINGSLEISKNGKSSKYVFELKFQNRTIYCKTGTKEQCFEGSWGETLNGDKFRKVKIWKEIQKKGWNGYFIQNGVTTKMDIHKLQFINNTIQGEGEDDHGKFEITGTILGEEIDFKKKYTSNNHIKWAYWGIAKDNKIEGKWGSQKPHHEGVFELYLVQ